MLTGKEEVSPKNNKTAKGNSESNELPSYLKSTYGETYKMLEPIKSHKGKRVFPQFAYGNSMESPSYFRTSNSILCRESYDNPYLKPKEKFKDKWQALRSNTLNNQEFYNISEQRFANLPTTGYRTNKFTNTITNQVEFITVPQVEVEKHNFESAYRTLQPKLFKRQRELFTDFIEKNDALNVYGPLNMRQRPKEFREVKNYALKEDEIRKLKIARSAKFTTSPSILDSQKGTQTVRLPQLDAERYYSKDQKYLNHLNNSIIRQNIDKALRHNKSIAYNSDSLIKEYAENELELIEAFEKHLEFEKQFVH